MGHEIRVRDSELNQYLVVGSGGFIGQALSKSLSLKGLPATLIDSHTKLTNFLSDSKAIGEIDKIVWAASKVNPVTAELNSALCQEEVRTFAQFLLDFRLAGKQNVQVLFLSSAGCIYSGNEGIFTEASEAKGTNAYGKLKCKMELTLENSGLDYSILRISNVYGPNQPTGRGQGVIAEWINAIAHTQQVRVFGSLESTRDYVYINDVAEAILNISESSLSGIYNVGSGVSHTLGEVVSILKELVGADMNIGNLPSRSTDRNYFALDISKILRESTWSPRYDLVRGVRLSLVSNISRQTEGR
jgi:UDP-glucose 4-epimerase